MGDPTAVRNAVDSVPHAFPLPTSRARQLDVALVGPDPDHVSVDRTRSDDRDRGAALVLRAIPSRCVRCEPAGGPIVSPVLASSCRIVGRQVTADDLPSVASIHALVDELTSIVDASGVMRIQRDRRIPIEAEVGEVGGPWSNTFPLTLLRCRIE